MGGMAHEPDMTAADSAPSEELMDVTQRFWIGSALAVPDFVLEMAAHVADGLSPKASALLYRGFTM
jgi:hypothetical protein|tara:strand:+ start:795 stop:992 length:198 start_codon:yes stop_codon:yes gene_type:complete